MKSSATLVQSRLPLPLLRRGKVREVYEVDDHHLLLEPGHVRVTWGPKENRFRPAAKTSSAMGSATQVILAGKCSFITL